MLNEGRQVVVLLQTSRYSYSFSPKEIKEIASFIQFLPYTEILKTDITQ